MTETYQGDAQDNAETFDETNLTEDGVDMANFDELEDVRDYTSALGDERDAQADDDFDLAALDDEDLETDEDVDDNLDDDLEDRDDEADDEVRADTPYEDVRAAVETAAPVEDAPVQFVGDAENVSAPADDYETTRQLSDQEIKDLGYDTERREAGGHQSQDEDIRGSGASPEDVPDQTHPKQEELLDEGIEETFPASDPVSVKHIT